MEDLRGRSPPREIPDEDLGGRSLPREIPNEDLAGQRLPSGKIRRKAFPERPRLWAMRPAGFVAALKPGTNFGDMVLALAGLKRAAELPELPR